MKKPAYIAIGDSKTPLCQFPRHMHHGYTCGHVSIASAKRAATDLKDMFRSPVRVIPGICPDSI